MVSSSRIAATDTTALQRRKLQIIVRINGVLPHITKIGTKKDQKEQEVMRTGKYALLVHICK